MLYRHSSLSLILLATLTLPAISQADVTFSDECDGTWAINLVPDDATSRLGAKTFDEALLFEDGHMTAEVFSKYGFSPTRFTITGGNPHYIVTLVMDSRTQGSLTWTGDIKSSTRVEGALVWVRRDGTTWRFNFISIKQPPASSSGQGSEGSGSGNSGSSN